jgi:hypothetical protein
MKARLAYIAQHTEIEIIDLDAEIIDVDAIEDQVVDHMERLD